MIIINFTNYLHGEKALGLANKVGKHLPNAIVAVSTSDIYSIAKKITKFIYKLFELRLA